MHTGRPALLWQYGAIALYVLFIAAPVLWLFSMAFKAPQEIFALDATWIPRHPTLENFRIAFDEQPLVRAALNSLMVSGAAAVLTVILSLPTAYVMARYRGAVSNVAIGWVLLSQMFPFILILIPLFLTMIRIGLYDSRWGLVLVYTVWNLPFALWMLRNFIDSVPWELEEQSKVDGATTFARLRYVVAPLLVPGIVTSLMFAFINSWNEFFFALVLIQDESKFPLSLLLVRFIGQDGAVRLGPLAAAALLATLPSLGFFALIQRRLTNGIVAGAVKG